MYIKWIAHVNVIYLGMMAQRKWREEKALQNKQMTPNVNLGLRHKWREQERVNKVHITNAKSTPSLLASPSFFKKYIN